MAGSLDLSKHFPIIHEYLSVEEDVLHLRPIETERTFDITPGVWGSAHSVPFLPSYLLVFDHCFSYCLVYLRGEELHLCLDNLLSSPHVIDF